MERKYLTITPVLLAAILVFSTISAVSVVYANSFIDVQKTANPTDIQLYGTGSPDKTTINLTVTGYGGTIQTTEPIDVVYAIDSSGSMQQNDPTNLRLVAAKNFTDKLDPTRDQAGVVSWDDNIDFTYGLTQDFTTLKTQIGNVDSSGGTNLNVGLNAAIVMLDANTRVGTSSEVIIFLSNGAGTYTYSGNPGSPADNAASKGYVIYSIGLGSSPAVGSLTDMANTTGGKYFSAPTAGNIQAIFDEILSIIITYTAAANVNVVEVTQSYIVNEGGFSIAPDLMFDDVAGQTWMIWCNVSQHVGNYDGWLSADETFTVTFTAGSSKCGKNLPVEDMNNSTVYYIDPDGNPQSVGIPQAFINVNCPPCCMYAYADPSVLWPPNHKLVNIAIMNVTDPDGDIVKISVTSIYQDEPTNGLGDGDKSPDGFGIGTDKAQIRSERSGTMDGRVYHIYFTAEDGKGGFCEGVVQVSVPHDQRGTPAADGGPIFDSTQP
jgi:Ca-activated chloride channel family protein